MNATEPDQPELTPQKQSILLGGVGLVKGRIRCVGPVLVRLCNALDPLIKKSRLLDSAPFRQINGIIRFGIKNDEKAEIGPVNRKDGSLPFAIEIELAPLRAANEQAVFAACVRATFIALAQLSDIFDLPFMQLQSLWKQRAESDCCTEAPH